MIERKLDITSFYQKGFITEQISEDLADRLLEEMVTETWLKIDPDAQGPEEEIEKGYRNRFIAARSMLRPNDLPSSYREYKERFQEWAKALIGQYKTADRVLLSALFGSKGYFMGMHTDVGDRCPFTTILYLGKDLNPDEDIGGNLNIFRSDIDDPKSNPELIRSIRPGHGTLVVLNNIDPTLYHSVDPLQKNVVRYQILSSFGIDEVPDWEKEIKEDMSLSGKILNPSGGARLGIDDHDIAMRLIEDAYGKGASLPTPKDWCENMAKWQ